MRFSDHALSDSDEFMPGVTSVRLPIVCSSASRVVTAALGLVAVGVCDAGQHQLEGGQTLLSIDDR